MKLYFLTFLSLLLVTIGLISDPLLVSRLIYISLGVISVLILMVVRRDN